MFPCTQSDRLLLSANALWQSPCVTNRKINAAQSVHRENVWASSASHSDYCSLEQSPNMCAHHRVKSWQLNRTWAQVKGLTCSGGRFYWGINTNSICHIATVKWTYIRLTHTCADSTPGDLTYRCWREESEWHTQPRRRKPWVCWCVSVVWPKQTHWHSSVAQRPNISQIKPFRSHFFGSATDVLIVWK